MAAKRITAALALSAALGLGACNDPAQLAANSDPKRNTRDGALAGGILGAGIAALSGASNRTAAVLGGAAAGAILGGAIGASLDRQAEELRAQLAGEGITVTNAGDRLVVTLPQDITFASDSFAVRESLRPDLARLAGHLRRYPDSTVQVIGHTDSDGDATYNQRLSERRAAAVAEVLQGEGVSVYRIVTIGRGEAEPVDSNLTAEGKARNRRVEIVIIPRK